MELDWLETFLAVVDRGGFTAASEQVHRSQSRVSAHIAGLERELNVRLIDRTHRPARLTPAGKVFAGHAREIVSGVGSARSAVAALRAMEEESLAVLATPCVASALFPGVLAKMAAAVPGVRVVLSERSPDDVERRFADDGVVLAVLPTLAPPLAPGLREQVLWREPMRVLVPVCHPLDRAGGPVEPAALAAHPLVVAGAPAGEEPEIVAMLAGRGIAVAPRVAVDTPQTLVAMVRAGVGIGVANAVAFDNADTSGLVVLDIDDPEMLREVAVYWYDVLLHSELGAALHTTVLDAPVPDGATAVARPSPGTGRRGSGRGARSPRPL